MFKRIDHIELLTAEPDRTVAFYGGGVGFRQRSRKRGQTPPRPPDPVYPHARDTPTQGTCYPEAKAPIAPRSAKQRLGWQCLALEVEDMDRALDALKAKGVACAWGPVKQPDYARAEIRDPDGNPIELRQWHRRPA